MFAVIKTGGKQYKVNEGQTIRVERLDGAVGDEVSLDEVLLVSDGETMKVGQPLLAEAKVTATIVEQHRAKKVLVFKKKRRKSYSRLRGHRQQYTALKISGISA